MEKNNNKKYYKKDSPDVMISKKLSYLLRHGAEKAKLSMDTAGYVPLEEIMELLDKNVTVEKIESIVNNNDKKRFEICTKLDKNNINCQHIRAV